ncbi:MarR family winged helix-turn-helix transcriptional regulator [Paucimonas lemoignei]|nr:MarR family winged helix-turn-helix transcriptional regulator [Paucimonas lemoignei]
MPLQQAATLITVALREGLGVIEAANLTDQTTASITRNLQALGQVHRTGKPGLNLVELKPNPEDGRKKTCHLTPNGLALVTKLALHVGR